MYCFFSTLVVFGSMTSGLAYRLLAQCPQLFISINFTSIPDLINSLPQLIAGFFSGVTVGLFSGMLGVGGGCIILPILRLAFGLPPLTCTSTSLFVVMPTSLSGALSHFRKKTCLLPVGIIMGCAGAVTSVLGTKIASVLPGFIVIILAAMVIAYSSGSVLVEALKKKHSSVSKRDACVKPLSRDITMKQASNILAENNYAEATQESIMKKHASKNLQETANTRSGEAQIQSAAQRYIECFSLDKKSVVRAIIVGVLAGIASGCLGIGGGFIMIPCMLYWLKIPFHKAAGTSLVAISFLSLPGIISYVLMGCIHIPIGIMLVAGSIPGAALGTRVVAHIQENKMRVLFGVVLVAMAVVMILNELSFLY